MEYDNKKRKTLTKAQLDALDDDNIPTVENSETIEEFEKRTGRGFWGSNAHGYVGDDNNK